MKTKPEVTLFEDGSKYWEQTFEHFNCICYLPTHKLPDDIINYGFQAPYLCVFPEVKMSAEEAKAYADASGLAKLAADFAGSVNFYYPTSGNWDAQDETFYSSIISNSKISQYYENGCAIMWNRFDKCWGDIYIRGSLPRTFLFGTGKSADYIVRTCLKHLDGDGIFGKGDITPACCILQNASVVPEAPAKDIPVISIGNSGDINMALSSIDYLLVEEEPSFYRDYYSFFGKFRRMVYVLDIEPDLHKLGLNHEDSWCTVPTAPDNLGDDKDTTEHRIGYVAYLNKTLVSGEKKVPLVLCFHGGGDSARYMSFMSGWSVIAAQNDFLLVCIENHLNSTATEMMAVIEHLKAKYPVDPERIYATGFSMGGCKSWDMMQEYPEVFAAVAPMDATFEVGSNSYGTPLKEYNQSTILPVFYAGGEITPLPELPFQAQKCTDRMAYVMKVNQCNTPYNVDYNHQNAWENKIWGISGDEVLTSYDESRRGTLTMNFFRTGENRCYAVFASVDNQGHEVRKHTCDNAWKFLSLFSRSADGKLHGGKWDQVIKQYS